MKTIASVITFAAILTGSSFALNAQSKTAATNKTLGAGGDAQATAGMNHFAFTTQESTIVLFGMGPVDFKYVNAADDPRNMKKSQQ